MFRRSIITLGVLFLITILMANVMVSNSGLSNMRNEDLEVEYEDSAFTPCYGPENEYIVVRGSNEIIYLGIPKGLNETCKDYIRDNYEELTADLEPVEEIPEEEVEEPVLGPVINEPEEEEPEIIPKPIIYNVTFPIFSGPVIIKEIKVIKTNEFLQEENDTPPFIEDESSDEISNFTSFEDFMNYLGYNIQPRGYPNSSVVIDIDDDSDGLPSETVSFWVATKSIGLPTTNSGSGYSTTNVQVTGVDEGDIIKNDNKYAYITSKDKKSVLIADVQPAENAHILTKVNVDGTIREIYLHSDLLVILVAKSYSESSVYVFNIKSRANPLLNECYEFEGRITQSRIIGDYLYFIANKYIYSTTKEVDLPVGPSQIYCLNDSDTSRSLTTFVSINVKNGSQQPLIRSILMGSGSNIYVSLKNIYITYTKYEYQNSNVIARGYNNQRTEKTIIHRISIENGDIGYETMGEATGRVLNRFSMSEYQEHFRIATTKGNVWSSGQGTAENQVYVLDMDLNLVGSVTDIAPGERIYSARFMGKRAYLVTFKKVDPFFVIDLQDPEDPLILGELKIPGYSNYLHPYDENTVIGIGKETVEAETGNFAWYQGVKLSLFDVSDVENPREISKYIIGDRGTNSLALNDPHAFLFSRQKNTLAIPIQLAKINRTMYPNGAPANTQGEYVWNGAYVFHISAEKGFILKGKITHCNGSEDYSGYRYWYGYNDKTIKRSFYIEDVLYTYSSTMLKMNNIKDLDNINTLLLS
jgi:uncharacterized secreted protein with C-terminal beta-propeller domain